MDNFDALVGSLLEVLFDELNRQQAVESILLGKVIAAETAVNKLALLQMLFKRFEADRPGQMIPRSLGERQDIGLRIEGARTVEVKYRQLALVCRVKLFACHEEKAFLRFLINLFQIGQLITEVNTLRLVGMPRLPLKVGRVLSLVSVLFEQLVELFSLLFSDTRREQRLVLGLPFALFHE